MFLPFLKKETIIPRADQLVVRESPIHGLGVFSAIDYQKGAIIETAPIILGNQQDYEMLKYTDMHDYYFLLTDKNYPIAIGLGFSSWYNHAAPANAVYLINKKKLTIQIIAYQFIAAGEEITLNYHGKPDNLAPITFNNVL